MEKEFMMEFSYSDHNSDADAIREFKKHLPDVELYDITIERVQRNSNIFRVKGKAVIK